MAVDREEPFLGPRQRITDESARALRQQAVTTGDAVLVRTVDGWNRATSTVASMSRAKAVEPYGEGLRWFTRRLTQDTIGVFVKIDRGVS